MFDDREWDVAPARTNAPSYHSTVSTGSSSPLTSEGPRPWTTCRYASVMLGAERSCRRLQPGDVRTEHLVIGEVEVVAAGAHDGVHGRPSPQNP